MRLNLTDTIVAISTPPGANGIGIVRLSGPAAVTVADQIFIPRSGIRPSACNGHTIHYGHIVDKGKKIDEVLLSIMRAPKTYTREDIVEINCHGGIMVLKEVLELVVSQGIRIAEPGEFTQRAFSNGRIDLTQAEAVLDIIEARTRQGLHVAERQLTGELSASVRAIRSQLLGLLAEIEADLNFPDEELALTESNSRAVSLNSTKGSLSMLMRFADEGWILREGVTAVICGKPNVGKSSLMNSMLKQNRVIVTPIPGTTRDTIEEAINIRGIAVRIVDTAGISSSEDELMKQGMVRSMQSIDCADLILLVLDNNDRLSKADVDIIDKIRHKNIMVVINKIDLPQSIEIKDIRQYLRSEPVIRISAKEKTGIDELKEAIYAIFWSGKVEAEDIIISNTRHIEAIRRAIGSVAEAINGINEGRPWDFISMDIKDAADSLGAITGEDVQADLITAIFSRFCIGK